VLLLRSWPGRILAASVAQFGGLQMRLTIVIAIVLSVIGCSASAKDMSFTLQEKDLRPAFDLHQWIFADGDIVLGTADQFTEFVKAHPQLRTGATVILNSPGGSPIEGIRLGDAIRAAGYRTDVGSAGSQPMQRLPGQCMSACIFPYLGGEYRYLADGSSIGIHQFRFERDLGAAVATDVSQRISGEIVSYIKRSRADPSLFALMTQTSPEEMRIISAQELTKLKVVTGDIYSESWTFEVHDGGSYLKADQITWRGENKIIFICDRGRPFMMTLSQLPDRDGVIRATKNIEVSINEQPFNVAPKDVARQPSISGDAYIAWTISLGPELVGALKVADSIGSGLSPAPGVFAGVRGIHVGDDREKLVGLLTECSPTSQPAAPMNSAPSGSPQASAVDEIALAKRVARNFNQQYKKAAMVGLRMSVEACYGQARKTLREESIEYCYLLDQLSCAIDDAMMQKLNRPQEDYWLCTTAIARTAAVLTLAEPDPQVRALNLQRWTAAKSTSLNELGSLR